MDQYQTPDKNNPLTSDDLKDTVEYLTNMVMIYDFHDVIHCVSDVREMVEELNEYHYRALTSLPEHSELMAYFEDMYREAAPDSEEHQEFANVITVLEEAKERIIEQELEKDY